MERFKLFLTYADDQHFRISILPAYVISTMNYTHLRNTLIDYNYMTKKQGITEVRFTLKDLYNLTVYGFEIIIVPEGGLI